ncbi:acyltransferase [Polynucleobacter sp. AP-Melu-500A-A1]|uniref:acyltransferase family protein n=1 Tax=Polynucleobacter sp. AP-Melu-500A-A1 TaxID=2576929 RepID=UPI001C0C501A|nr:acyltransferase [Polynucleobacter sp. AP-Melu-500A-A1]
MINSLPEKKLLGLEVLRFISAMAILVFHYHQFAYVGLTLVNYQADQQPFYTLFKWFYLHGELGVQFFWCISGFIFFWKYQNAIHQKIIGGGQFFVLRLSRLYPLHFATLLLIAALQIIYFRDYGNYFVVHNNDLKHFILQLFLASNWGGQGFSFNAPIWSISVEVLIYLFFFLVLRYVGKAVWVTLLVLLIAGLIKFNNLTESFIVDCIIYFYLGGLTAQIFKIFENTKYQKFILVFSLLVVISPLVVLNEDSFRQMKTIFLLIFAPALIYIAAVEIKVSQKIGNLIEALGNMTYSSYLIHLPLQLLVVLMLGALNIAMPFYSSYFFIFYMALVLCLSRIIYLKYEKPMQDFIRLRASNLKKVK